VIFFLFKLNACMVKRKSFRCIFCFCYLNHLRGSSHGCGKEVFILRVNNEYYVLSFLLYLTEVIISFKESGSTYINKKPLSPFHCLIVFNVKIGLCLRLPAFYSICSYFELIMKKKYLLY
jgi:hypothetical protein